MNRVLPKLDNKQFEAITGRSTTHARVWNRVKQIDPGPDPVASDPVTRPIWI